MKKALKAKNTYLLFCLLSTFLFILGIPLIIIGAVQDNMWILGFAIAFLCINFYAMPILWTSFPHYIQYYRITYAIDEEKIFSINQLSMHFSLKEDEVKKLINTCIKKGYLVGYLFDGNKISVNYNINKFTYITTTCSKCGAPYYYKSNEIGFCPYCKTPSNK